ncbi:MAG TPA: hypothetical protein VE991_14055, partial [Acidimicrobiales bacterium]|nr:hypothetical protein [Acidimicrobiales bacterium]
MDEVSRFALLASAVCGRPLQVTATGPGEPAWTDGTTVFVDEAVPDPIAAVTVQAALIAAGSLQPDVLAVLRRRPALVPRYLAVEGQRALLSSERLLPAAVRVTLDRELAARSDSPAHSLQLASSGAVAGHLPSFFGTIRPRHVHAGEPGAPDHGAPAHRHVSRRAATAALRALDDGEEEGAVADFTSPVEGGGGIGRLLKRLFGDARTTGGGPPGADAPTHLPRRAAPSRRSTAFSSARPPAPDAPPPAQRPGYRYPEWDRHRRSYRLDWCTVIESEPEPSELQPFEIRADVAMRRALGRLGTGFERRRRQVDGDDLDVDAVVEARAEVVAGTTPNDGLFIDSVRRRRDLAVLVLLDVSASAGELGVLGVPVHEHQRRAAAALVSALHGLGDRVALYAFRSQGRAAVHVVTVKRFGDELDELVRERLGGLV